MDGFVKSRLSDYIPAVQVTVTVSGGKFRRRLYRDVNCLKREVTKKRLIAWRVTNELDETIDEIFGRIKIVRELQWFVVFEPTSLVV